MQLLAWWERAIAELLMVTGFSAVAWQKHRDRAWDGSQGDLLVWGWHQHWGSKPSEEGSSGQVLAAFLWGWSSKSIITPGQKATNKHRSVLSGSSSALGSPHHQDLCLSLPSQHPAWSPCSTWATASAGYWLQLHFSAAARNAIFFISVYKLPGFLSTTLDYPQGRWEFLPGQAFHLVSLSWSSRVAASCAVRYCLGEPGLAQTQLFMFSKPCGN